MNDPQEPLVTRAFSVPGDAPATPVIEAKLDYIARTTEVYRDARFVTVTITGYAPVNVRIPRTADQSEIDAHHLAFEEAKKELKINA